MTLDPDIDEAAVDEAILVAAARTKDAQAAVADELGEARPPRDELTETVVERADDLKELAREALDEGVLAPDGSGPVDVD